jgi:hypothetical protein
MDQALQKLNWGPKQTSACTVFFVLPLLSLGTLTELHFLQLNFIRCDIHAIPLHDDKIQY